MPKNKGVAMPSVERYRSSAIGPILPTAFRPDLVSTMICTEKQCHYISKARLWQVKSGLPPRLPLNCYLPSHMAESTVRLHAKTHFYTKLLAEA